MQFIPIWGPYTQARDAEKILRRIFNVNKTKKSSREKFANTNQKTFAELELAAWIRKQQELVNELREKPDPSERFSESVSLSLTMHPDSRGLFLNSFINTNNRWSSYGRQMNFLYKIHLDRS